LNQETKIACTGLWDNNWQADQKLNWAKQNPHVCVLPFINRIINIEFDGQRDINKQKTYLRNSCCCNLLTDADPTAIDQVKKSVSQGQLNSNCQRCYNSEQQTGSSERTMALLDNSSTQFNEFLTTANITDSVIGIKFSNLCNLACRSCSPTFSSKYAQVHQLQIPKDLVHDIADNPVVWTDITENITQKLKKHHTINLSLFGGESLIQPGALRLIDWLNEKSFSSQIILNVTTNFTNLQTRVVKQFDQFKQVNLFASIDSIEENYDYVRSPGRWTQITTNLQQILPQLQNNQLLLTIQPLWNLNNIFYIIDYLDWWHLWFKSTQLVQIPIKNVIMFRPFHMTIQNLPIEYRSQLKNLLQQARNHAIFNNQQHDSLSYFLDGMIDFLSSNNEIYNQFELYLFDTAKHDRANQTQMQVGNKKFYDILSADHQQLLHNFQITLDETSLSVDQQQAYRKLPL
jgi:organic radical activating enzyme